MEAIYIYTCCIFCEKLRDLNNSHTTYWESSEVATSRVDRMYLKMLGQTTGKVQWMNLGSTHVYIEGKFKRNKNSMTKKDVLYTLISL